MRTAASKEVSTRFIAAMDEIIRREKEQGNKISILQFAKSINHRGNNVISIRQKRRDVTLDMLITIVKKYNVSPDYLLLGKGEMFVRKIDLNELTERFTREVLRRNSIPMMHKAKVNKNNKKHTANT